MSIMRVELKTEKEMVIGNRFWTPGENKWTRAGFEVSFRPHGSQFYFVAIINCKIPFNCFLTLFLGQKGQSYKESQFLVCNKQAVLVWNVYKASRKNPKQKYIQN